MSTYRQRKDAVGRARDDKPCPDCGHSVGQHRGYPVSDCIHPGCKCAKSFAKATR